MSPNRFRRRALQRSSTAKPDPVIRRSRLTQVAFGIFLVLCLVAVGWRVLRPILWPRLHHETPKQTSSRMFDDNSFFR
jgi:hypothetical protein